MVKATKVQSLRVKKKGLSNSPLNVLYSGFFQVTVSLTVKEVYD